MSYYQTGRKHYIKHHKEDKTEAQYFHSKSRARERYGIHLSRNVYNAWIRAIQDKEPDITVRKLGRESNTLTHFAISWDGREIPVVYDRKRKTIKTVLPESGLTGPVRE